VIRRLLLLVVGSLAFWVLVSLPVRALTDDPDRANARVAFLGTALLLCLVPTGITLAWGTLALQKSPEQGALVALGGTGVRMFATLLAAWVLVRSVPFYRDDAFWFWLGIAYLFTLALEITLLLAGRPAPRPEP
jgi:hypothetical protein